MWMSSFIHLPDVHVQEKTIDPFVLYGGDYINLKRVVSAVVFTRKTDDLSSCVKVRAGTLVRLSSTIHVSLRRVGMSHLF